MITSLQCAVFVPTRWITPAIRWGTLLGVLLCGSSCLARPAPAAPPGAGAFPALQVAAREQAALVVSAGEDPARWPAAEVRAVATRWNAAALEASHTPVMARLLQEQWELLVSGAAEAWSRLALVIDSPPSAYKPAGADVMAVTDTLAILASDARAFGDDAAAILPAVRAVCSGKRAALLLTTSVGCECTMQRAAMMEDVWTALAAGRSDVPESAVAVRSVVAMGTGGGRDPLSPDLRPFFGRSDLASSPDLPDALGLDRVPGWLLLEPGGEIAFRVDGGEGVTEITAVIRRWLCGEDLHR